MLKKISTIASALMLSLILAGCGANAVNSDQEATDGVQPPSTSEDLQPDNLQPENTGISFRLMDNVEAEQYYENGVVASTNEAVEVSDTSLVVFLDGTSTCPATIGEVKSVQNQIQIFMGSFEGTPGEIDCGEDYVVSAFELEASSVDFTFEDKSLVYCAQVGCLSVDVRNN